MVRQPHLLGQTLPCPRCKHPIAIPKQRPDEVSSRNQPAPSLDSAAITKEDYGDWDEVLANIPPNPLDDQLGNIPWDQIPTDWEANNASAGVADRSDQVDFPVQGNAFIPLPSNAPLPNADREWESRDLAKKRQVLLVATLGVVSSIVAGFAFWGFLQLMQTDTKVAQNPVVNADETPPKNNGDSGGANDTNSQTTDASNETENSKDSADPKDSNSSDSSKEPENSVSTGPKTPEGEVGTDSSNPKSNDPSLNPGSGLTDFLHSSDPAKDTSPSTESTQPTEQEKELTEGEKETTEKLPDIFGPAGFGPLLGPASVLTDGGFGKTARLNELDIEKLDEPVSILTFPDPQPVPSWAERAGAIKIGRIKATEISLVKCIELFGRMTGVGITLDWPSVRAAGMDDQIVVSFDAEDTTLEALFQSILSEKKLAIESSPDGLPIVRPLKEGANAGAPVRWKLAGIAPAGKEKEFYELLVSMWEIESTCSVEQDELVWLEASNPLQKASLWTTLQLLARLQSKTDPVWPEQSAAPKPLFDPSEWKASLGVQSRTVASNVVVPELRSVSEILQMAADETKTKIMIDWQAVWQHGLTPGQMDISVLRNRTFPQIMKKFLENHSLELLVVGRDSLMLTTPEARKLRSCVVPLKIPAGMELADFKRLLYQLAPSGPDGRTRFRVSEVPGLEGIYFARVTLPQVDQLDDSELETAFGW